MCPLFYRICRISFHQSQPFQAFTNYPTGQVIHITEIYPGLQSIHRCLMRSHLNIINILLPTGKFLSRTDSRRHITCIPHGRLSSGIHQQHIPFLYRMPMIMIMKSLSAYRSNGRERQVTSMHLSHRFQCRSHLMLLHPNTQHTHCLQMHFSRHITCTFNLCNLFFRLIISQVHNPFDKRNRRHLCSRLYP